jgi:Tfp pilus assembly protein PilF
MISGGRLLVCLIGLVLGSGLEECVAQRKPKSSPIIDSLERRMVVDSNDALLHYDLAMAYWKVKRFDDAERELKEAVHLAPQYAEAYLALSALPQARGEKYWKKIEKDQGEDAVLTALESASRHYRRAFLLNPLVDLRVLGEVKEMSEIREGDMIIWVWWLKPLTRSMKAFKNGKYQEAFNILQRLLEDEKAGENGLNLPEAVLWYHGLTAAVLGKYDTAIHDFAVLTGRAVADEKADPVTAVPLKANDYRYVLATMYYLAGRHEQAVPTFRRALEFDIALYPAHVQLARIFEAEQKWEEAIVERRAAVNANPDDATLLTDLGQTLLRAGRLNEASEALENAMRANSRDPLPPYLAGIVALRMNERASARAAFKRFLQIAPTRYARQIAEVRSQLPALDSVP